MLPHPSPAAACCRPAARACLHAALKSVILPHRWQQITQDDASASAACEPVAPPDPGRSQYGWNRARLCAHTPGSARRLSCTLSSAHWRRRRLARSLACRCKRDDRARQGVRSAWQAVGERAHRARQSAPASVQAECLAQPAFCQVALSSGAVRRSPRLQMTNVIWGRVSGTHGPRPCVGKSIPHARS
jgi:hypothetical protein